MPYEVILLLTLLFVYLSQKPSQWQLVFLAMGAISIVGIIIFTTCASGDIQPWAAYQIDVADEELETIAENKTKIIEPDISRDIR